MVSPPFRKILYETLTLTNPNSLGPKPVGREGKGGGGGGGLLVMWLYYSGADQWTPP